MGRDAVKHINKWLKGQYGSDLLNRPIFRIVWSEDELEKRAGTFEDFYGSILCRTWKGVRECKKYGAATYKERFILEKLIFGIDNQEIWGETKNGTYEPVWVFRGPGDTYQVPTLKATEFVLRMLLGDKEKRTQKDVDYDEAQSLQEDIETAYEALGGPEGDISSHLRTGSGIVVP